jgi:dTDP-4-dehydrorhamnose reductase
MKVLVVGRTGQLAVELARTCLPHEAVFLGREVMDLARPDHVGTILRHHLASTPFDAVLNAAAWTAVDAAEANEHQVFAVNATSPGALASVCAQQGVPFVHLSSAYVFDGIQDTPYQTLSPTRPLSVYGRSKAEGEERVRAAGGVHAIVRTNWVLASHGRNLLTTLLGRHDLEARVVADQFGGPTPARELARALWHILTQLDRSTTGTFHYTGTPDVPYATLARAIFAAAKRPTPVVDLSTGDWPSAARRPGNARLDSSSLSDVFGLERPDWQAALPAMVREWQHP